ncbi:MAG: hypothetical protein LBU69_04405 [Deltaproteobacteria bacterium]|nr:hypothetical protein [Deltaproteobacteria bacterium]
MKKIIVPAFLVALVALIIPSLALADSGEKYRLKKQRPSQSQGVQRKHNQGQPRQFERGNRPVERKISHQKPQQDNRQFKRDNSRGRDNGLQRHERQGDRKYSWNGRNRQDHKVKRPPHRPPREQRRKQNERHRQVIHRRETQVIHAPAPEPVYTGPVSAPEPTFGPSFNFGISDGYGNGFNIGSDGGSLGFGININTGY